MYAVRGDRNVQRVSPEKPKENRLFDRPWRKWKEY